MIDNSVNHQHILGLYTFKSIVIGIVLSTALLLFVMPFPTYILDALVVSQWLLGIILLSFVWAVSEGIHFNHLPKWLIGITLSRLCVNIATTRSILAQATGGGVIDRAGELMMGNRWIVGAVFFFGLLSVQYIVIARGLERIAQLTARFNLEALPGAQQAISIEQGRGYLHPETARRMRLDLEERSRSSSAVEGVLKFIKGEQVASFCLIIINLVGGGCIGYYHESLSIQAALNLYGKLAIGDGLLAQLPALYCSLATTVYVTRLLAKTPSQTSQFNGEDRVKINLARTALGAAVGIGIVALLPIWKKESQNVIFVEVATLIIGTLFYIYWPKTKASQSGLNRRQSVSSHLNPSFSVYLPFQSIESAGGIDQLKQRIDLARNQFGLPQRDYDFFDETNELKQNFITVYINGEQVAREYIKWGHIFTLYDTANENSPVHPKLGVKGTWRKETTHPPTLSEITQIDWIVAWILYQWRTHETLPWTVEEVWTWLNSGSATLVSEALEQWSSPVEVADIIRELSAEGCSIVNPNRFLEGLVRSQTRGETLPNTMKTTFIRRSLGLRSLLGGVSTTKLGVIWIEYSDDQIDKDSRSRQKESLSALAHQIKTSSIEWMYYESELVVMIDQRMRKSMQDLLSLLLPGLRVLSPDEVPQRVKIDILKVITPQALH